MSHVRLLPRSVPSAERMVVAEGWWAPYSQDRPHLLYSVTKSFIAIAVGFAVADGLLRLDDRVADVLEDHVPAAACLGARQLTVHHLLTMTTGHRADTLQEAWALEPADLVKGFLRVPAQDPAGTRHTYNNPTSFVLARMVERVTGRSVPELLDDRLFGPMGVEGAEWDRVASGARRLASARRHRANRARCRCGPGHMAGERAARKAGSRGWRMAAVRLRRGSVRHHQPESCPPRRRRISCRSDLEHRAAHRS